jgi:predicted dehydrogenase
VFDKLKFALVGCGTIGKRYINILSQHPQAELTALIDKDENSIREFKNLHVPFFQSTTDYFNSGTEADVLIIATPNGTHASLSIEALQCNRHVLIEKPMALKKTDAEAIIRVAKEANKKAMVVLQNRFSPVSVWLKQLIESGQLGKLFFVQVNCFWNRDERYYRKGSWHGTAEMDGGTLFTQFSHFIDTLYWLFGDVKNINSRFRNFVHKQLTEIEDTGTINFEFGQGGIGSFNFSTAAWDRSMESSMTIISENGSIKIAGQYMNNIDYCHIKNCCRPVFDEKENIASANHYRMIDAMIKAVREDGETNAEEALNSVHIIERMYECDRG